jgi:hypothetical protein
LLPGSNFSDLVCLQRYRCEVDHTEQVEKCARTGANGRQHERTDREQQRRCVGQVSCRWPGLAVHDRFGLDMIEALSQFFRKVRARLAPPAQHELIVHCTLLRLWLRHHFDRSS